MVESCNLNPYRVDRDASVMVPIDSIESKIKNSFWCIAEITTDNPNVWYELRYAYSCGKPVIMVCSDERLTVYPFDIRHRYVLNYKTSSISDFKKYGNNLRERILAILNRAEEEMNDEITETDIVVLRRIMSIQDTPYELVSKRLIVDKEIEQSAMNNTIRRLVKKRLVEYLYSKDESGFKIYYRLTERGESIVLR